MRSDLSGKTFLIVDDEPDIREFLMWEFEDRGGRVLEAGDVEAGGRIFQQENPDFSLLDVRMPGGTGLDLLTRCKAMNRESPIALMTGYTEVSISKIYSQGACDVFVKPLNYELLFPRVDKELVPVADRYSQEVTSDSIQRYEFEQDFESLESKGALKLGRGGFCLFQAERFFQDIHGYYRMSFAGLAFDLRLCWAERLPSGEKAFGFEFINIPKEILPDLIEKMQTISDPAYIPGFPK